MSDALVRTIDWLRSKIFGYDGYVNIEKRKEVDALVRDKIQSELGDALTSMSKTLEAAFDENDRASCLQLEKARAQIESFRSKVKNAGYGYRPRVAVDKKKSVFVTPKDVRRSGKWKKRLVFLTDDITAEDLDRIIRIDEIVLQGCEQVKATSSQLTIGSLDSDQLNKSLTDLVSKVRGMSDAFQRRRDIMMGVSGASYK